MIFRSMNELDFLGLSRMAGTEHNRTGQHRHNIHADMYAFQLSVGGPQRSRKISLLIPRAAIPRRKGR